MANYVGKENMVSKRKEVFSICDFYKRTSACVLRMDDSREHLTLLFKLTV